MRKTTRMKFYKGLFSLVLCMLLVLSLFPVPNDMMAEAADPFVVMLDPGHGGVDGGAVRDGSEENEFNMKLVAACRAELASYDNVLVYVTRENDSDISTYARSMYAKRVQADLFISFHINADNDSSVHGAEIYVPHGNWKPEIGAESRALAAQILNKFASLELPGYGLSNNRLKNRGVKDRLIQTDIRLFYPDGSQGDYYEVIRMGVHNDIPSMIIEHAFISNAADLKMLRDDEALKKLGKATADAIAEQYKLTKTGKTLTQPSFKGQTAVINMAKPQSTATVGGAPITLSASGGNGNGEYVFYSNNEKVIRIEGNKAYIVGAGEVKFSVTKYEDGTYLPRSLPEINRSKIVVSSLETQLQLSIAANYRGAQDDAQTVVLSCRPAAGTEYGAVPHGTVTFYKDGLKLGTAQFQEDGSCTFAAKDIAPGNYTFTASYEAGNFDGFTMTNTPQVSYLVEQTEPTFVPLETQEPDSSAQPEEMDSSKGGFMSTTSRRVVIVILAAVAGLIVIALIVLLIYRFFQN